MTTEPSELKRLVRAFARQAAADWEEELAAASNEVRDAAAAKLGIDAADAGEQIRSRLAGLLPRRLPSEARSTPKEARRLPMGEAKVILIEPEQHQSDRDRELFHDIERSFALLTEVPERTLPVEALARALDRDVDHIKGHVVPRAADLNSWHGLSLIDAGRNVTMSMLAKSTRAHSLGKQQIAAYCATHIVESHETILMDGGNSTLAVFEAICKRVRANHLTDIRVITNSARIPQLPDLAQLDHLEVVCTGGILRSDVGVFLGPHMTQRLRDLVEQERQASPQRRITVFVGSTFVSPRGCGVLTTRELKAKPEFICLADPGRAFTPVEGVKYRRTEGDGHVFAPFAEERLTLITDTFGPAERPDYVKLIPWALPGNVQRLDTPKKSGGADQ